MSNHIKVLLEFERGDGTLEFESVWAVAQGPGYRLDNIPFYARGFALGDLVSATPDPDGLLRCTGLVVASGHSTVRLWIAHADNVPSVRKTLRDMECNSELDHTRLVAVDVPPNVPYAEVRAYLDEKERTGVLEYEEACIGQEAN